MKLRIEEFEELAKRNGYKSSHKLWRRLDGGLRSYKLVKSVTKVGYEIVKNLYNAVGEEETVKVIDFEEETINGFKAKYTIIGNQLY